MKEETLIQDFQKLCNDLDNTLSDVRDWKSEDCDNSMQAAIPKLEKNLKKFLNLYQHERIPESVANMCCQPARGRVEQLHGLFKAAAENFRPKRNNSQSYQGESTLPAEKVSALARSLRFQPKLTGKMAVPQGFYGTDVMASVAALLKGDGVTGNWPYFSQVHLKICMLMLELCWDLLQRLENEKIPDRDVRRERVKKALNKLEPDELLALIEGCADLLKGELNSPEVAISLLTNYANDLLHEAGVQLNSVDKEVLKVAMNQMIHEELVKNKYDFEVFRKRISELCSEKLKYGEFMCLLKEMDIPEEIKPASESILKNLVISGNKLPHWKFDSEKVKKKERLIALAGRFSECYLNLLVLKN